MARAARIGRNSLTNNFKRSGWSSQRNANTSSRGVNGRLRVAYETVIRLELRR